MRTRLAVVAGALGLTACSHHARHEAAPDVAHRQGPVSQSEANALVGTWTVSVDARGRTRTSRLIIELQDSVLRAVMDPPAGGSFEYATELMEGPTGGANGWQPQPFWVHGDLLSIQFRSLSGAHLVLALEVGHLSVLKGRIGECDAPFIPNLYAQPDANSQSHCYSGNFTATRLSAGS